MVDSKFTRPATVNPHWTCSADIGDLDNDGDMDMAMGDHFSWDTTFHRMYVCLNELESNTNRNAIGARVEVFKAGMIGSKKGLLGTSIIVRYTTNVMPGDTFTVNFSVRNIGSSPFYYSWPVEVSLLNPETKQPVWKTTFRDIDIRRWLPGDKWDKTEKKYKIEPEKNQINGKFLLPADLPKGEYILGLSIIDPAGNVPAVRFAVKNYFKGGRHPIGKIGIGKKINNFEISETVFDDLYSDRTLFYEY